ncbi:MAG: CopG family transcriptional regulator [Ruminococcaceae bacterium]|nr:CopG family transcriptional regulator [Oscillospiraceae bacterium]
MKSTAQRKISVTLPGFLVEETDRLASSFNRSRSEIVALAIEKYLKETEIIRLREQMKKGYPEMGEINLSLAEDSLLSDESACKIYEDFLSECE